MAELCEQVERFVDGALDEAHAHAFRLHLPGCARCQSELEQLLQLRLLAEDYAAEHLPAPAPRRFWHWPPSWSLSPRFWLPAAALTALAVLAWLGAGGMDLGRSTPREDVWLARTPQRVLEARSTYPGADSWRPLASASTMGATASSEVLPLEALSRLERQGDEAGVLAAYLVREDWRNAAAMLEKPAPSGLSPEQLANERAVLLLNQGRHEEALRLLEDVLARQPQHPQARWNRALVLRALGLRLRAARAFSELAQAGEPGWAQEALQKAEVLQRQERERRERWLSTREAGERLVRDGVLPPPELLRSPLPSLRLFFYDAVRMAPSSQALGALRPMAEALEGDTRTPVLARALAAPSAQELARRRPLTQAYARLLAGTLPAPEQDALLRALRGAPHEELLRLGTLVLTGQVGARLEEFESLARAVGDPWFEVLVLQERARAQATAGRSVETRRTWEEAERLCRQSGVSYRCLALELELAALFLERVSLDEAWTHARRGYERALQQGEWEKERQFLQQLAQVARFRHDEPLARAYLQEVLERVEGDARWAAVVRGLVHEELAALELDGLRFAPARQELDAALATGQPLSLNGVAVLADVARREPSPGDEPAVLRALEATGGGPGLRALGTHLLGRLVLERDAPRGRELLRQGLREAEAAGLEEDAYARRARSYGYTSLLMDAGKHEDWAGALALLAEELRAPLPARCLLAVTTDSERSLVVARGADGALLGAYEGALRQRWGEELSGKVPGPMLEALRSCERVEVFARPPLAGRSGLLPPELAWSYRLRPSAPPLPPPGPAVHLVISDVDLPGEPALLQRGLKPLRNWNPDLGPEEQPRRLTGADATPARVLQEMEGATEVDLVAHGVVAESSAASYLVLSPDPDGEWRLQAPEIRRRHLSGAPLVVLAACHAARPAPVLHEPFSLPAAFIDAGARGVIAATVEVASAEANPFFNAVRARLRAGQAPAQALRDERMQWLRAGRGTSWLGHVLLFE